MTGGVELWVSVPVSPIEDPVGESVDDRARRPPLRKTGVWSGVKAGKTTSVLAFQSFHGIYRPCEDDTGGRLADGDSLRALRTDDLRPLSVVPDVPQERSLPIRYGSVTAG
jgi:hypothetical protein